MRRILKIFWPRIIANVELKERTKMPSATYMIKTRRCKWIGHILKKVITDNCRIALIWVPPERRSRGRPKDAWRRMVKKKNNFG